MLIHTEARELKFSWLKTNIRDILLFHGCSFRQILQIFCLNMQYFSRFLGLIFFCGCLLWNNQIKFILLLFKAEHLFSFSPETGLLLISILLEAFRWRRVARKGERSTQSLSLLNTSLCLNAWNKLIDFQRRLLELINCTAWHFVAEQ